MPQRIYSLLAIGAAIIGLSIGPSHDVPRLPTPPTPQTRIDLSGTPPILSDGQFVNGPNVGNFDVAQYLQDKGSPLADHAGIIELWCGYASVNPRVVLTLIERQSGLVERNPTGDVERPLGGPETGVERQIEATTVALATAFYDHLYVHGARSDRTTPSGAETTLALADGIVATLPAGTSSGTYAVAAAMAPHMPADAWSQLLSPSATGGFVDIYQRLFPDDDPLDPSNQIADPTAPPADLLQFPFPVGATWWFNGVHNWNGGSYGRPYSSMDFGTAALNCSYPPSDDWIVAAAGGTGYHPSDYSCWYRIDHGNGWMTSYYHLLNPQPDGSVERNEAVGTIACEICAGGFATSPHVHFSLLYNGAYVELDGTQLSGWTIHEGDGSYSTGYIERDGVVKTPYNYVTNDGIPDAYCGDAHEPNDDPASATTIDYGDVRLGLICPAGDEDLFAFTGQAGDRIVIGVDAASEGSSLDSLLHLLDSDGTTVLAENDDETTGHPDSLIHQVLPHDGTFTVRVRDAGHPTTGGEDLFYTLEVVTDTLAPTVEIISPATGGCLDPNLHQIEVEASDGESGVARVEFLWHDNDWSNPDWTWLGIDEEEADGWSFDWDTSAITEQSGIGITARAYDWADHSTGATTSSLILDRTPPTVAVSTAPLYGDAPFRDFWVNLEDGCDNMSGIATYDVQSRDGIEGMWTDWMTGTTETTLRFVGEDGHTYFLRARARDRAGNVGPYTDGTASRTVTLCPVAADAYEADDTAEGARWILPDEPMEVHNVHTEGDMDWVRFYAAAGITYTLVTTNTGGHADTVLTLYNAGASRVITSNDDYPGIWPASRIDWRPARGSFYWASVEHWDPWACGCTTEYGLTLAGSSPTPPLLHAYLPLIFRSDASRR